MVAEISNESRSFIWHEMDIVEGLNYCTLWWQKNRVETVSPLADIPANNLIV